MKDRNRPLGTGGAEDGLWGRAPSGRNIPHGGQPVNAEAIAKARACGRSGCGCGRRHGKEWRTHCPVPSHGQGRGDQDPSLHLADGDGGKPLANCKAHCSQDAVIGALRELGLWPQIGSLGVTLTELAAAKGLPLDFLRGLGWRDGRWHNTSAVVIPYLDAVGGTLLQRHRIRLQGSDHYRQPKGVKLAPYGLNRLEDARRAGCVLIVEGVTDAATCWANGLSCLALPGARAWRPAYAQLLEGLAVYIWREPGGAGAELAEAVTGDLPDARCIEAPPEAKDPNALWLALDRDHDAFRQRMEQLIGAALPAAELRVDAQSREAEEALVASRGLLDRLDLLSLAGQTISDLGYAGDLRQPLLLYLAITSRLLAQPVNVTLRGPSAAGKTFLGDTVAKLFPASAIYDATASSERAWVYTPEDFRHRFLLLAEAAALHHDGVGASILRSVAWGGRIAYDTVEKTADGLRGRRIEKEGPTGVITTSTRPLEGELATRFLTLEIPDDPDQTRAVLRATAAKAKGAEAPDLAPLIAVQAWLQVAGVAEVAMPFVDRLAELFPADLVRARRDFLHLLTLVQSHALLHQRQRRRDERGRVVAELADYRAVHRLAEGVFAAESAGGVTETVRQTVASLVAVHDGETPVTVPNLAVQLGVHRSVAYRRAMSACDLGFLVNQETRPGRPLKLVPGEPLPEQKPALPHPSMLGAEGGENPPQNRCIRATATAGQIDAESERAVATDDATAIATEAPDMTADSDVAHGCNVAGKIEGRDAPWISDDGRRVYVYCLAEELAFPAISLGERRVNGGVTSVGVRGDHFAWEQVVRFWPDHVLGELMTRLEESAEEARSQPAHAQG